jgi:2-hydroxy-6-oxonona-2,4-dienedioate hydrolase
MCAALYRAGGEAGTISVVRSRRADHRAATECSIEKRAPDVPFDVPPAASARRSVVSIGERPRGWQSALVGVNEAKYRETERRYWGVEGVMPTEEWRHLSRTGSRVRVQVVGEGPPVLFVHGVNNGGTSWAPLVARLDGFRRLVLDRPGCGLSEPLAMRVDDVSTFASFAETLLVDVLDALELKRVHVVATSLGGYHALRTAAAYPDRIRRVVELGWTVGAPNAEIPLVMRLAGVRSIGWVMARVPVSKRAVRSMLAQVGLRQALDAGRVPQEGVDWFHSQLRHTNTMRNDIGASPPIMHPIRGVSDSILLTDDLLERIRVPVYFVWGAEDPFGGGDVAARFVARMPSAELEILPGGGHAVWLDDPDRVATATKRFLAAADNE